MKPAKTAAVILAMLALLALAGCQAMSELGGEFDPRQSPAAKAFFQVANKYLVEDGIHKGPGTELLIDALPANWEVRRAWIERRAVAFDWTKKEKEKDLADQKREYENHIVILASVYVPQDRWNDWDSDRSNWRVFLVNARGERLSPSDARRIKKRSAINEAIYPFWGSWSRLYVVKFPWKDKAGKSFLGPKENTVTLQVVGPPGRVKLELVVR